MIDNDQLCECNILIRKAIKAGDTAQVTQLMVLRERIMDNLTAKEYLQAEQTIQAERPNSFWPNIYNALKAFFRWTKA